MIAIQLFEPCFFKITTCTYSGQNFPQKNIPFPTTSFHPRCVWTRADGILQFPRRRLMARKWLLEIDKKAFSYGLIYVESGRLGRKFNKKKMFF
uniref:hypothetical protein n=1 Tax=Candidatus Limisoma sp. TaxID=3076476 RepID=UPI004028EEC2